jgi:circadian clock protein KaiB
MNEKYKLRLYVMGGSSSATRAIHNLKTFCTEYMHPEDYELEIVDLSKNVQMAEDEQIFATPLLERRSPGPVRRVIGDLSNFDKVLFGIDIRDIGDTHEKKAAKEDAKQAIHI